MIIKKHNSGNEFIYAGGVWVRNFCKDIVRPVHISPMFRSDEFQTIVCNEESNKNYPRISDEKITFDKIVIVSDGYQFEERHKIISKFPRDVAILATNKVLKKWSLLDNDLPEEDRRSINAYVINNPYEETMHCLPERNSQYYPVCISSSRTNSNFLKKYKGDIYTYASSQDDQFGLIKNEIYYIDDYRNPICACIGLAHQFNVKSLMLLCCDDSFNKQRESSIKLSNGLWTYPQQIKSQEIINANLYWLTHREEKEVKVGCYSSGSECINAAYITSDEEAIRFFNEQEGANNEQ